MSQKIKRWDVVVVGGGIAGGAAAIQLAKNGKNVLLLEKEPGAHDKVCGEFLSLEAQHHLMKLGLNLQRLGATPINKMNIAYRHNVISANLPFCALSLSRKTLDEAILCEAQLSGAHVRRNSDVMGLTQANDGWRITVTGQDVIEAPTVFLATGKHDLRGWRRQGGSQKDFIGFKMHYRLSSTQNENLKEKIDLILFDGGYAGLEPIEEGIANLCLVVTKKVFFRHRKKWDELLHALCKATPHLAERLAGANPCWPRPLSIFGIPYGYVYRAPPQSLPGLYRLGDQLAVIPSLSGYGISIALHTASLAVESYLQNDLSSYFVKTQESLLPLIRRTSFLSQIMSLPWARKCLLLACHINPKLITVFVKHNRITEPLQTFK